MQSHKLTTIVGMCRDDGRIYASALNACRIARWTGIVAASLTICCMVEWPWNGLDYFYDRHHHLLIINSSCSHSYTRTVGRYIYNNSDYNYHDRLLLADALGLQLLSCSMSADMEHMRADMGIDSF